MENWQQWRKDTADKLLDIEDHDNRREELKKIQETSEYKESKEENREFKISLNAISYRLCHGKSLGSVHQKQFEDIREKYYPLLISELKKDLKNIFESEDYRFEFKAISALKNDFPEIKEFIDSEEIKEKYESKVISLIERKLESNSPSNSPNFNPFEAILEIKEIISEVEDTEKFEEHYKKLINDIENNILKFLNHPIYLIRYFDTFVKIVESFPEIKSFVESDHVKKIIDKVIENSFNRSMVEEGFKISQYFNIPLSKYEIDEGTSIHILHTLYLQEDFENAEKFMKVFPESRGYFSQSDSLKGLVSTYLEEGSYDSASEICRIFKIPKQEIFKEVKDTFKLFLTKTPEELSYELGLSEEDIEKDGGTTSIALNILSNFDWEDKDLKPFFIEALRTTSKAGDLESIEKMIDYFNDKIDIEEIKKEKKIDYISWLSKASIYEDVLLTKKIFTYFKIKRQEAEDVFNSLNISFENKFVLNLLVHPSLDQDMYKCYQLFGYQTSEDIYNKIKDLLHSDEIPEEFSVLNVTETGEKGFEQLQTNFHKIKESWFTEIPDIEAIKSSDLIQKFFKNYVDYRMENEENLDDEDDEDDEDYRWGNHDQESFDQMLQVYSEVRGEIEPLPKYMTPSPVLEIDRVDRKAKIEWSEQFYSQYHQLLDSINKSIELIDQEKKPLSVITSEIYTEYQGIINILKDRVESISNEKAKIGMRERIESLESIDIRSIKEFQDNFRLLARFRELHPLLQKTIFTFSFLKNKGQKNRMSKICGQTPDLDNVTTLLDFVDHITNQETMSQYFSDKQSKDAFKEIIRTKGIQEELSRIENRKVVGKTMMQFVPVRNILTEFSGHIADACWASKYESILKDFPNFTSVILVKNPNSIEEKLAGACFLIETEDDNNGKVLIIRGLNPTQSVINGLSISDFFEKFKEYIRQIADKDNRKVLLVMDDHSGGASTNRPNLFAYMENLNLSPVRLKNIEDTEFNGYDITDMCVSLEE